MKKSKIIIRPFDVDTIDKAISDLKRYENELDNRVALFFQTLTERGVEIAKTKVIDYGAVFTSDLLNSIHSEIKDGGVYAIVSDSKHTAFVEFGTGQVGEANHYPYEFPDGVTWEYNQGATIFEIHDGQYGWYYPALDGTWKFTQGMPSRPFMYETAMELASTITKVAKEVFK